MFLPTFCFNNAEHYEESREKHLYLFMRLLITYSFLELTLPKQGLVSHGILTIEPSSKLRNPTDYVS